MSDSESDQLRSERAQDEMWVLATQAGDREAFDYLVLKYQHRIFSAAYRILRNLEDANDVAQEAFVKAYLKIGEFRCESRFSTWLFRIVVNLAKSRMRWLSIRKWVSFSRVSDEEGEHDMDPPDPGPSVRDHAQSHEIYGLIEEAIKKLPPEFREAVVLRDIEGFSYDEISDILKVGLGTVKSRINRARGELRKMLGGVL